MAFPEDYFLPARSVLDDSPPGPGIEFYQPREEQLLGLLLMLNERASKVNLGKRWRLLKLKANAPVEVGGFDVSGSSDPHSGYYALAHEDVTDITYAFNMGGYDFVGWSGDFSGTNQTQSLPATFDAVIEGGVTVKPTGEPDPALIEVQNVPVASDSAFGIMSDFRGAVFVLAPFFINTVELPGGSLENKDAVIAWTVEDILDFIGTAEPGLWTLIPARNPYGLPATGTAGGMIPGTSFWKEHVNEIAEALDALDIPFVNGSYNSREDRTSGFQSSGTSCDDAKSAADAAWDAASWVAGGTIGLLDFTQKTEDPDNFDALEVASRGKVSVDLSLLDSGTPHLYLILVSQTSPDIGDFGKQRPTTADENKFGEWAGAGLAVGSPQTTDYVQYTNALPGFATTCPLGGRFTSWAVSGTPVVVITDIAWQYTL